MSANKGVVFQHPPDPEVSAASVAYRTLAAYLARDVKTQRVDLFDSAHEAHRVEMPTSALVLLLEVLSHLSSGTAVEVLPVHADLTKEEAADILNVPMPYLEKLMENGALPSHPQGSTRKVRVADLMQYKALQDRLSEQAMQELAKEAQELGLGYE